MFKDIIKEPVKRFIDRLIDSLLDFLGKEILGRRLKLILTVLLGAVVVWLVIEEDDEPEKPIEVDPLEIWGLFHILGLANDIPKGYIEYATQYRRAFARGFGDTLSMLISPDWQSRIKKVASGKVLAFKNLPTKPDPNEWIAWSYSPEDQIWEYVDLDNDKWTDRFIQNEIAVMYVIYAWYHRRLDVKGLRNAQQTALQQASSAGISAAVQQIRLIESLHTYEFLDEDGKIQRREGGEAWNAMVHMVQKSGLSEKVIRYRLYKMAISLLPLPKW